MKRGLTLFHDPVFSTAAIVGFIFNFAFYGLIFVFSLFFQTVQARSAFETGLVFALMTAFVMAVNLAAGRLKGPFGLHPLLGARLSLAAGYLTMLSVQVGTSYAAITPPFAAWRRLVELIRYKAVRASGGTIARDARRSSGTCSIFGAYAAKPLSVRWHACACGASLYRDHNAARVMLARGLAALAATGEAVSPGTPTWAATPCVVPELSSLPMGSAGDGTSDRVINPR